MRKSKTIAFDDIPKLHDMDDVKNSKKIKVNKQFYRIRVGDYRIGFRLDNNILVFMRALHRKDIYRYFP